MKISINNAGFLMQFHVCGVTFPIKAGNCLIIFEAKIVSPFAYFCSIICADDKSKSDPYTNIQPKRYVQLTQYIHFMSVVYLLLFVRIEHFIKIYNTLHLVFFKGYTYQI